MALQEQMRVDWKKTWRMNAVDSSHVTLHTAQMLAPMLGAHVDEGAEEDVQRGRDQSDEDVVHRVRSVGVAPRLKVLSSKLDLVEVVDLGVEEEGAHGGVEEDRAGEEEEVEEIAQTGDKAHFNHSSRKNTKR